MFVRILTIGLVFIGTAFSAGADDKLFSFLKEHCVQCHGPEKQKGDIRFDGVEKDFDPAHDEVWLSVIEQLESREMPPKEPSPTEAQYVEIIELLTGKVNPIDWRANPHAGHVTLPRLTKIEYNNTIRDLLGIDMQPGRILSLDGEGKSGFTNDRDNLFLTPSEMEKYFSAAELAVDALQSLDAKKAERKLEAEEMLITESGAVVRKFPDGSKGYSLSVGQMTLYESLEIMEHGFYRFHIRGASNNDGDAAGLLRVNDQLRAEFAVRGKGFSVVEQDIYLVPGIHQVAINTKVPPKKRLVKGAKKVEPKYAPLPDDAPDLVTKRSELNRPFFPTEGVEDEALLAILKRYNANQNNVQRAYEWLRLHGPEGKTREISRFKKYVRDRTVPAERYANQAAELMGIKRVEFDKRFEKHNVERLANRRILYAYREVEADPDPGFFLVDWMEFSGPVMPKENVRPELAKAATAALNSPDSWDSWFSGFIDRAFREPVLDEFKKKYRAVYEKGVAEGLSHPDAAKRTVSAVLVSPRFLFRSEELPQSPDEELMALGHFQLASRLSYFLWQTCPDAKLNELAAKGQLSDPDVIRGEVSRMLADPKAKSFFETFPGQWLGFEALGESVLPDRTLFPGFTVDLAEAMKTETRLLFQRVFQEDLELLDLLTTDKTYLNQILARHYGIKGVTGLTMELVALSKEDQLRRGGILGMGSVLTATSTPVRTSPVLRGVWILERLLGDAPGEPPADAGELPGNAGNRGKTFREELAIHRDREDCAFCHDKIDPLGYGLEQFDAIGQWRATGAKGKAIDSTGTLPDGTSFNGVAELREFLVSTRRDEFVENLSVKLLSFALGRELQRYDEPAIQDIGAAIGKENFRARALVEEIVLSYPFRHQHLAAEVEIPVATDP